MTSRDSESATERPNDTTQIYVVASSETDDLAIRNAEVVGYRATPSASDPDIINAEIPVDAIVPNPRNYNVHPDEQIEALRESDRRFGQVRSIVVQAGAPGRYILVAGEGYWTARKAEGHATIRADIIPASWTPLQVHGYLVADNELSRGSRIDELRLAELQEEQRLNGYDLAALGTTEEEHLAMLERLAALQVAGVGGTGNGNGDDESSEDDSASAPDDFRSYDDDIPTDHTCPKCGYKWSGQSVKPRS